MRFRILFTVIACPALVAHVLAQTTGSVSGYVRDKDRTPLPGATVTISGPNLPKERSTITLPDGAFRFGSLVPGTYRLKAELSGMGAFEQEIVVALGKDTEVWPALRATLAETMTVTPAWPIVDTRSTEVSAVTTKETLQRLPLARTYTGTFQLASGVAENNSTAPNAGGGRQDNTFLYDGVNVTNPFFGDVYQDFAELDIREVSIKRGGITAEFGRTGGFVINGVTKSGTKDFHGEARLEYSPSTFQARAKDPQLQNQLTRFRPGVGIGGPILRDSLFFYGSANFFRQTDTERTTFLGPAPDGTTDIREFFGKLTAQPLSNHLIDVSLRYRGTEQTNAGIGSNTAPSVGYTATTIDRVVVGTWSWNVDPRLSVEAKFNHNTDGNDADPLRKFGFQPPFDPLHPYLVGNFVTGQSSTTGQKFIYPPANDLGQSIGGYSLARSPENFFRDEYRLHASYLASLFGSSQDIRLGASYSNNREDLGLVANGWGRITVNDSGNCGTRKPCFRARYNPQQPDQVSRAHTWGIFAQDQITWNRLTVNVGALINRDTYIPNDNGQFTFIRGDYFVPNSQLKPCGDPAALATACTYNALLTFDWSIQIQPRVGIAYEINPSVHDRIFATFGRYDNLDNQSIARAAAPIRLNSREAYFDIQTGELITDFARPNQTNKKILPNIDPTYTDEWLAGYESPLGNGWSLTIWGMYRKTQDIIEDFYANLLNTNGSPNPVDFRYGNIPGYRKYKAGTIEIRKAFGGKWMVDASYTLSKLSGNWDLDFGTSLFYASSYIEDGPGLNVEELNRTGTLIGDRTHVAKLFAAYQLSTNTTIGGYLRFQSGRPWEARGFDPVYATDFLYLEPAGSRRTSSWTNLDILVAQSVQLGKAGSFRIEGRLQNVFNVQTALTVYQDKYTDGSNTIPNDSGPQAFRKPRTFAPPRRFLLAGIFGI